MCPIDGSAAPKCLTEANQAMDTTPVFSPDGKTLAYLAMSRPRYEADRFRIVLKAWPDGEARVLTEAWDYSVSSLGWAKDGTKLLATAPNKGQTSLFAVDAATGKAETLVAQGTVGSFAPAAEGIVFERNTLKSPAEIYLVKPGAGRNGAHGDQRGQDRGRPPGRARAVQLQGLEQRDRLRLHRQAGRFRRGPEIPGRLHDPRRPAGIVRQRFPLPLEPPGLRRRRLRGGHGRFPRLDRVRAGLLRFDPRRLGRQAPRGPQEGPGRGAGEDIPGWTGRGSAPWALPTAAT